MKIVEEKEKVEETIADDKKNVLFVMDDDYNTFMHVINCLMTYCGLGEGVAELFTYKIHNDGECGVMRGDKNKLLDICETLIERGLNSEVREYKEEK
jgi:ATP-dependent Clp protease adapter protein ClpS